MSDPLYPELGPADRSLLLQEEPLDSPNLKSGLYPELPDEDRALLIPPAPEAQAPVRRSLREVDPKGAGRVAELQRIARGSGYPLSVVEADPKDAESKAFVDKTLRDLEGHPGTTEYMSNPSDAAMSVDDVPNMSYLERQMTTVGAQFSHGRKMGGEIMFLASKAWASPGGFLGTAEEARLQSLMESVDTPPTEFISDRLEQESQALNVVGPLRPEQEARRRDLNRVREATGVGELAVLADDAIFRTARRAGSQPALPFEDPSYRAGLALLGQFGKTFVEGVEETPGDVSEFAGQISQSGVRVAALSALTFAATAPFIGAKKALRVAKIVGKTVAFGDVFVLETSLAFIDMRDIVGVGPDGTKMDIPTARLLSLGAGAINAPLEMFSLQAATRGIPGLNEIFGGDGRRLLLKFWADPKFQSALKIVAGDVADSMTVNGLQEFSQGVSTAMLTLIGHLSVGNSLDDFKHTVDDQEFSGMQAVLLQAYEQGAAGFRGGLIGVGGAVVGIAKRTREARRVVAASETADLSQTASVLKTTGYDPEKTKKFVQLVQKNNPDGAVDAVHLDPEVVREFLQTDTEAAEALAGQMPNLLSAIEEAAGAGNDLVVPIAEYIAYVAPATKGQLENDIRRDGGREMSVNEAQAVLAEATETGFLNAVTKDAEQFAAGEADRDAVATVRDEIKKATEGRFGPSVAAAYAEFHAERFLSLATQLKISPAELLAQVGKGVTRSITVENQVEGGTLEQKIIEKQRAAKLRREVTDLRSGVRTEERGFSNAPIIDAIRSQGGIAVGSAAATQLAGLGVNEKTIKSLTRKKGKATLGEFDLSALSLEADAVPGAISAELQGQRVRSTAEQEAIRQGDERRQRQREAVARAGLDLATSPIRDIEAAVRDLDTQEVEGERSFNQQKIKVSKLALEEWLIAEEGSFEDISEDPAAVAQHVVTMLRETGGDLTNITPEQTAVALRSLSDVIDRLGDRLDSESPGPEKQRMRSKLKGLQKVQSQLQGERQFSHTVRGDDIVPPGGTIAPSLTPPTAEEIEAARTDTRTAAELVAKKLDALIPETERVHTVPYTVGAPDGRSWGELTDEELNTPGAGFPGDAATVQRLFDRVIERAGEGVKAAIARLADKGTVVRPPALDVVERAFGLSTRAQLWYEVSGAKFADALTGITGRELALFLDLVGVTSPLTSPRDNLYRAIGIFSQLLRAEPIDVDLVNASPVRKAIARAGDLEKIGAVEGNKTGQFSNTHALVAGIPTVYPFSVNDVWMAALIGISDAELGSNQDLHVLLSDFMNELRDHVNQNGEFAFEHQAWQVQARLWVAIRESGESGDDYAQVWDQEMIPLLQAAGIETTGELTREMLTDPRLVPALRPTVTRFREANKATIEIGTTATFEGVEADSIYQQAVAVGDEKTQGEYFEILVRNLQTAAKRVGGASTFTRLARVITGVGDLDLARTEVSQINAPLQFGGSWAGQLAPNARVPLYGLDEKQRRVFLAYVGRSWQQAAMAAPRITLVAPQEGQTGGWSIFTPAASQAALQALATALPAGFNIQHHTVANGVVIHVLPHADTEEVTTEEVVLQAGAAAGLSDAATFHRHTFENTLVKAPEYDGIIKEFEDAQGDTGGDAGTAGADRGAVRGRESLVGLDLALSQLDAVAAKLRADQRDFVTRGAGRVARTQRSRGREADARRNEVRSRLGGLGLLVNGSLALPGIDGQTYSAVDLAQGADNSVGAQRALYKALGLEVIEENTGTQLKVYNLTPVFGETVAEVEAKLEPWLNKLGWTFQRFGPDTQGKKQFYPNFRNGETPSYDQRVAWIFNPAVAAGSFRDEAYTLAWRVVHEIAHGIVNAKLTEKYGGQGHRAGALGIRSAIPFARGHETRTLADALRAVDWEVEAFKQQLKFFRQAFGVEISKSDFQKENSINFADAVYRAITGEFGNPGEIGVLPGDLSPAKLWEIARDILYQVAIERGLDPVETFEQERTFRQTVGVAAPAATLSDQVRLAADQQRGAPEAAMNGAQRALRGGGVLSYALEHVGDLTHRIGQYGLTDLADIGQDLALRKVKPVLAVLTQGFGFLREHQENMVANGADPETVSVALTRYADAHRALPDTVPLMDVARDAAVALGELRIEDAAALLQRLRVVLEKPTQEYLKELREVAPDTEDFSAESTPVLRDDAERIFAQTPSAEITDILREVLTERISRGEARTNVAGFLLPDGTVLPVGSTTHANTAASVERLATERGIPRKPLGDSVVNWLLGQTGAVRVVSFEGSAWEAVETVGPLTSAQAAAIAQNVAPDFYLSVTALDGGEIGYTNFKAEDISPAKLQGAVNRLLRSRDLRQEELARIRIRANTARIQLLQNAGLHSFLHESMHLFILEFEELLLSGNADLVQKKHWGAFNNWLGRERDDFSPLSDKDNEKLTRASEVFFFEGVAPTPELQPLFDRFRLWLRRVYQNIERTLGIDAINDEVREAFGYVLAAHRVSQEVAEGAELRVMADSAAEMGMTEAEFSTYQETISAARSVLERATQTTALAEVAARNTEAWRENWDRIEAEVQKDVGKRIAMRARHFFETGGWLGDTSQPPELGEHLKKKLDRGIIKKRYGADYLRVIPNSVMRLDSAVDPDIAAPLFGFTSGDAMLRAIAETQTFDKTVEVETRNRLTEEFGPARSSDALAEAAYEELTSHARINSLVIEDKAFAKKVGGRATPLAVLRRLAREKIANTQVGLINPHHYRVAAARLARESAEAFAKGDFAAGQTKKRNQMLNVFLEAEARKAKDFNERAFKFFKTFEKRSKMEKLGKAGAHYLEAIQTLLSQFELSKISLREISRRGVLADFVQKETEAGRVVDIPQTLLDESNQKNWKELTHGEVVELKDTIDHIAHLANLKSKLLTKYHDLERAEVVAQLTDAVRQNVAKLKQSGRYNDSTLKEFAASFLRGADAELLKMEVLLDILDGGEIDGPFRTLVWRPLREAQAEEQDLVKKYSERFIEMFEALTKGKETEYRAVYDISHLGIRAGVKNITSVTKFEILQMVLNMANDSNYTKMLEGWGVENQAAFEQFVFEHTEEADWDWAQSIWNMVGELWPMIEEVEQRRTGLKPKKIVPRTVITPFGLYGAAKGEGYIPIMYDVEKSRTTHKNEQRDHVFFTNENLYAHPLIGNGFTEARIEGYSAPIRLDLIGVPAHLSKVIHYLTHFDVVSGLDKVLSTESLQTAIEETMGSQYGDMFTPWLQGIARSTTVDDRTLKSLNTFLRFLRTHATVHNLAFRWTTLVMQATGHFPAMRYLKRTLPNYKKYYGEAILKTRVFGLVNAKEYFRVYEEVIAKSKFMRQRVSLFDRDQRDVINRAMAIGVERMVKGQVALEKANNVTKFGMQLIGMVQLGTVDIPVWLTAYNGFKEEFQGKTEADAIDFADRAVSVSQGSGGEMDLAAIQRGGEAQKMLVLHYSYMSAMYANLRQVLGRASEINVGQKILDMAYILMLPAVATIAIKGRLPDLDDDEDGQNFMVWLAKIFAREAASTVPVVRDVAQSIEWGRPSASTAAARATALAVDASKFEDAQEAAYDIARVTSFITGFSGAIIEYIEWIDDHFIGETKKDDD